MKYLILLVAFVYFSLTLFSQKESINWIVFIDEKIPDQTMLNGEIICFEGTIKEKIINFEYIIGDIKVEKTDINYIKENIENTETLTIKLYYKENVKETQILYIYSFKIPLRLLFKYSYVVLEITNINKKKGIFYFDYLSEYEKTVRLRKKHGLFIVKNSPFFVYSKEVIMKEVGAEKRKVMIDSAADN